MVVEWGAPWATGLRAGVNVLDHVKNLIMQEKYLPDRSCSYIDLKILNSKFGR